MRSSERLTATWRGPAGHAIPAFVVVLLGVDLAFAIAFAGYFMLGQPFRTLIPFIDLDGEANLPTWYASIQWFCVGSVFWVFADRNVVRDRIRSWPLVLLPVIFVAFSLDEVAAIHEFLGVLSDHLLPTGSRYATLLSSTGLFFLVVGIPFAILFAALVVSLRPLLVRSARGARLLVVGMSLFLFAAVGIDALSNFVTPGTFEGMLQVTVEELTEMVAATLVLWSGYELIRDPGREPGRAVGPRGVEVERERLA
jgi:hypothetical protein